MKRLQVVTESTHKAKEFANAVGARALSDFSQEIPGACWPRWVRGRSLPADRQPGSSYPYNTIISNVPGPQVPLYFVGARMVTHLGTGPLGDGMGTWPLLLELQRRADDQRDRRSGHAPGSRPLRGLHRGVIRRAWRRPPMSKPRQRASTRSSSTADALAPATKGARRDHRSRQGGAAGETRVAATPGDGDPAAGARVRRGRGAGGRGGVELPRRGVRRGRRDHRRRRWRPTSCSA